MDSTTTLQASWFREGDINISGLNVGLLTKKSQVAVGVSHEFPYQGLLLLFPEDKRALLFQEEALDALLEEFDFLLHTMVDSGSTKEAVVEGASIANTKVSLPN